MQMMCISRMFDHCIKCGQIARVCEHDQKHNFRIRTHLVVSQSEVIRRRTIRRGFYFIIIVACIFFLLFGLGRNLVLGPQYSRVVNKNVDVINVPIRRILVYAEHKLIIRRRIPINS